MDALLSRLGKCAFSIFAMTAINKARQRGVIPPPTLTKIFHINFVHIKNAICCVNCSSMRNVSDNATDSRHPPNQECKEREEKEGRERTFPCAKLDSAKSR